MYSSEYDVCDVTLSVYPHRASLKNMPGHGGNRTYDLWNTSPMLCQLSYAVRSVRVCDISELSLVPSMSMQSIVIWFFLCWCCVLRWIWCLWCYSECISTPGKLEKYAWPRWESNLRPLPNPVYSIKIVFFYCRHASGKCFRNWRKKMENHIRWKKLIQHCKKKLILKQRNWKRYRS